MANRPPKRSGQHRPPKGRPSGGSRTPRSGQGPAPRGGGYAPKGKPHYNNAGGGPRPKGAPRPASQSGPRQGQGQGQRPGPAGRPGLPAGEERIQKILAYAGIGSRRACEELILQGRITVDGQVVRELGTRVDPARVEIAVDGQKIHRERLVYFAVHKPKGYVSTNKDPGGRPRVVDLLPEIPQRVYTVGRLDEQSTGLMILTNDGELANKLAHPKFGVEKVYRVVVAGDPGREVFDKLVEGVWLAEGKVRARRVRPVARRGMATVLEMVLAEGKNREVRRMLAKLGHKVMSLVRTAVGPVGLKGLPVGSCRPLTSREVELLQKVASGQYIPSPHAPDKRPRISRGPSPAPSTFDEAAPPPVRNRPGTPPPRGNRPPQGARPAHGGRPPVDRPDQAGPQGYRPGPKAAGQGYRPGPKAASQGYRPGPKSAGQEYRPGPKSAGQEYRPGPKSAGHRPPPPTRPFQGQGQGGPGAGRGPGGPPRGPMPQGPGGPGPHPMAAGPRHRPEGGPPPRPPKRQAMGGPGPHPAGPTGGEMRSGPLKRRPEGTPPRKIIGMDMGPPPDRQDGPFEGGPGAGMRRRPIPKRAPRSAFGMKRRPRPKPDGSEDES